jgi:hypothetical protein
MRTPISARFGASLCAFGVCLLLLVSLLATGAQGAPLYTKEPFKSYEEQLAAGQVKEVTINKRLRSVRVTLTDGRHVVAKYKPHEESRVRSKLVARHIPVHVLSSGEAKGIAERGKTKVHHKIRYIVGGVAIGLVVIIGAVVFYRRRGREPAEI